ncbi:hypothetical protein POM88_007326 [Heracleum sosnowskyi]|uniref:Uncharacterized protein n=1 Tax=Heracleum sosnowskyi TaxID=360622 RepID=A0AAD8J569_9APIA|nr:hypothetical protein POM88_007326 [Heracleum sosnowskyi]
MKLIVYVGSSATTHADVLLNCDRRKTQSILSNVWDFDLEMMIENFDPKPNTKSLWQSQPKTQSEFKRKNKRTPLSPLTTNITLAGDGNGFSSQQFSPQTHMPPASYKSTANRRSHSAEKMQKMNISTNGRPKRSTCFSPNTPSINEESEYTGQNNTMPFSPRTYFSPNVPFPQHQPKSNISQCYNSNNGRVRNNGKEKSKVFDLPNTMPLQILDFNEKQKQTSQNDNYYDLENSEIYGFQDLDNETTDSDKEVDDQLEDCDQARLWWFRINQTTLHADLYSNICDSLRQGNSEANNIVNDIKKNDYFGVCLGVMYVVEFQKRGISLKSIVQQQHLINPDFQFINGGRQLIL